MEKIMRELRDDELEKVSGGLDASKNEVAVEGVVGRRGVASEKKHVAKMCWDPISFEIGLG
jgi:hypothetical protein